MGGSKPVVAPAQPQYTPSQEALDFIARTPGAAAEQKRQQAVDPTYNEDKWASLHYEATKNQPGVYWGRTRAPEPKPSRGGGGDWRSAASDAGWTPPDSATPTVRTVEPSESETAAEQRKGVAERKRVGRRGTIFSSAMGISEEAPVQRKTLLGV